jgi:hypothetical membrane protein
MMKWLSVASTAGIVACCILGLAVGVSMQHFSGWHHESYSLLNHFVSELGRTGTSPFAVVFNGALMVTALLLIVFAIGLRQLFSGWSQRLVSAFSIVAFLACFFIGVFPVGPHLFQHLVVAGIFFPSVLALVGIVSVQTVFSERPSLPRWTATLGALTAIAFAALLLAPRDALMAMIHDPVHFVRPPVWGLCILEWICFATVIAWILAVAIAMRGMALQRVADTAEFSPVRS